MKNDLFLKALRGETVDRPPVWMMRQAGRYLPEFMEIRNQYDFFTRCQTPELASEITVQPLRRFGMDAAILFSDILVIPQAMNIEVQMKPDIGPWLPNPIRTVQDVIDLKVPDVSVSLNYVMEAIEMTLEKLEGSVPLIGFAGAPWTILCYCVQGQGSKSFDKAKAFCFTNPKAAHLLLQKITDTTIAYLKAKVASGVHAVQLFDSWGGDVVPNRLCRILTSLYQTDSWGIERRNTGYSFCQRMLVRPQRSGANGCLGPGCRLDLLCHKCPLSQRRADHLTRQPGSGQTTFTSRRYKEYGQQYDQGIWKRQIYR